MVSSTPRPHFTAGKDPVPILQETGWAPGPVWTGEKSRPHRYSIPDRPARSQSLYRLSYRAQIYNSVASNIPNSKRTLIHAVECAIKQTINTDRCKILQRRVVHAAYFQALVQNCQKATTSFVMFARLSVCMEHLGSHRMDFSAI